MVAERVNSNSILKDLNERKIDYSILNMMTKRDRAGYTEELAKQKAGYLADKFNNPSGLMFYLKCAWNLTDQYIDWLVEYSLKKENPGRYFSSVANKKMLENA